LEPTTVDIILVRGLPRNAVILAVDADPDVTGGVLLVPVAAVAGAP
jgi:hypothetical protein